MAVGGMAEVLLATKKGIGGFEKLVVIKRILPNLAQDERFVQMFLNEARLAASLRHPHIVEIYDIHQHEQNLLLVMEYLSGEDLRYLLNVAARRGEKLPVPMVCRVMADVADGLHHAHTARDLRGQAQQIVHRDVAPSNIILTFDGQAKLVDFGVAKARVQNVHTRPGVIKGKFAYVSPEQIQHKDVDARSDLFSFGVVLHELLTIRRLFTRSSDAGVLKAVLEDPIAAPSTYNPEVPEELDRLVLSALNRDPDRRPRTAAALREQLEHLLDGMDRPSHREVGQWVRSYLEDRLRERQVLEREVAEEHKGSTPPPDRTLPPAFNTPGISPVDIDTEEISISSSLVVDMGEGSAEDPPAPEGASGPSETPQPPGTSRRPRVAWILAVSAVCALLLAGALGLAYQLGSGAARSPSGGPAPSPASAALMVHVAPEGSTLAVDGEAHKALVGPGGVLVPAAPGAELELAATRPGFAGQKVRARVPGAGVKHVYISLAREARPDAAPPPAKKAPVLAAAAAPPVPAPDRNAPAPAAPAVRPARRNPGGPAAAGIKPATLAVIHEPEDATLELDGRWIPGRSPRSLAGLTPGKHQVKLQARGYQPQTREVELQAGQRASLTVKLVKAAPAPALLAVVSTPPGARVLVDGSARGTTPLGALELAPGSTYKLELSLPGFRTWSTRMVPVPGKNPRVLVKLERLPAPPPPAKVAKVLRALKVPKEVVGNAVRGRALFSSRCGKCHGRKVKVLSPARYTGRQWCRFFSRGKHRRKKPLMGHLSITQMADIKAYLIKNAVDSRTRGAAGIR